MNLIYLMKMTKGEQKLLLQLARRAIEYYSETGNLLEGDSSNIPPALKKKQGCFVTLTIDGKLRGCIGYLEGQNELWQDVVHNAVSAGFEDPRFPPLSQDEIPQIEVEISVLAKPQSLNYTTTIELLDYLRNNRPGVIIKRGYRQATYLPQVWEDLAEPIGFLTSLCHKAGLPGEAWEEKETEIVTYEAEYFKEGKRINRTHRTNKTNRIA